MSYTNKQIGVCLGMLLGGALSQMKNLSGELVGTLLEQKRAVFVLFSFFIFTDCCYF